MSIYTVNIVFIIIFAFFIRFKIGGLRKASNKQGALIFSVAAGLNWILISGLRHESVGDDTSVYMDGYIQVNDYSWSELWLKFVAISVGVIGGKDPGYPIFEKFTQTFIFDYTAYLLIVATMFTGLMTRWIYKYSSDVFLSFLIYSILFFAFFSITGIRQTIATALVVFIGYELIIKRKLLWFLLVVLVAATIHKSALVFVVFYFLFNMNLKRAYLIFFLALWPILFIFREPISSFFKALAGLEEYGVYEGAATYTFTLLMFLIGVATIWKYKYIVENNVLSNTFINAYVLAMFFLPLTFVNPSAMRVVQYFSIFLLLLIPEIVRGFHGREKALVYIVLTALLVVMFFKGGAGGEYYFFWQSP
ncbi:EpsG family protein [Thiomicrorhabdus sp. 6S2-11]|uniref:EpsG family protein n=1 Tax=Thiomicrorhabdus marina TaxID=2818442 RepID=A0ABS3Q3B4_9GAMM|nr:EpsG family protein [Thiomicrorhabdus marina]MBO1926320.1 EpsG family protein [Thiomicrorhabdus marina]